LYGSAQIYIPKPLNQDADLGWRLPRHAFIQEMREKWRGEKLGRGG
jgi:hypothetical protein